jgi:hypothetical protein
MTARQRITYRDAVILLSGKDTALVEGIDKLLGGVILASSILLGPAAFVFLEVKDAALSIIHDPLAHLGVGLRGLTIPARGDRVRAATATIAVTAFIEAARDAIGKERWQALQIKPQEIVATGDPSASKNSFLSALVVGGVPTLEPNKGYDTLEGELERFYQEMSKRLTDFI